VLRAVDVLDAHEPDEVRVRLVVVERDVRDPPDGGLWFEVVDLDFQFKSPDPRVGALEDGDELLWK
jgi:hypothetical protein